MANKTVRAPCNSGSKTQAAGDRKTLKPLRRKALCSSDLRFPINGFVLSRSPFAVYAFRSLMTWAQYGFMISGNDSCSWRKWFGCSKGRVIRKGRVENGNWGPLVIVNLPLPCWRKIKYQSLFVKCVGLTPIRFSLVCPTQQNPWRRRQTNAKGCKPVQSNT